MIPAAWLNSLPFLADAPAPELDRLADSVQLQYLARGEVLYEEGGPGIAIYGLRSGRVKTVRYTADGAEQLVCLLGPGDGLGLLVALDGAPYPATAIALEPCEALRIPVAALRSAPSTQALLTRTIATRLREQHERMRFMSVRSGPARLAALLVHLSVGRPHEPVAPALTHQELGAMIGLTRETVSRAISQFRAAGLIETRHDGILVRDPARLATEAE